MKMFHPVTGGKADTTQEAFDEAWKDLGWELVEEDNDHGYAPGASPAELAIAREEMAVAAQAEIETGTTPDDDPDNTEQ